MNILIIGNGGREHALAWKIAQSEKVSKIFVAPGNAGTANEIKTENVPISVSDIQTLVDFANENTVDLTIVGPEVPLVLGIVDIFQRAGLACFGPTQAAAQLEGSKTFTKDFLIRHNIPTADYASFTEVSPAIDYIRKVELPIVIKADGLAAGKGVVIAHTQDEAIQTIQDMLKTHTFGDAGKRIIIESFLQGEEASFICMVDGTNILPLATSQDHKARDVGDKGPNTGGMGAYSPAPIITSAIHEQIMVNIIEPTVRGMAAEGNPYTGFLYAGLMIDSQGKTRVLEYNCRFGDPEAQPILMRLRSDLVELCLAALDKRLDQIQADWNPQAALGVVLAAGGYPQSYQKGLVINGLDKINTEESKVFHAGTIEQAGKIITAGGRVLCACALGKTVQIAQSNAYQLVDKINWDGMFYRSDIGYRAL
ncbi:MAG: phosphoribosylamine--glycine ligase [Thiomargarita sp.]|nr:phosphoribosylamine--glycine ligase [Thiomargarita sp.]